MMTKMGTKEPLQNPKDDINGLCGFFEAFLLDFCSDKLVN